MADDDKKLEKDQRDTEAEEDPHSTGPAENLRKAAENLREEAAEKVDQDDKSRDSMLPQDKAEHEPTAVNRDQDNPEIVEKRKSWTGILAGRPILILLVIGAIVLGGFLLYNKFNIVTKHIKLRTLMPSGTNP